MQGSRDVVGLPHHSFPAAGCFSTPTFFTRLDGGSEVSGKYKGVSSQPWHLTSPGPR